MAAPRPAPKQAPGAVHERAPQHVRVFIYVWAFICMSTNIKVAYVPYIDWIVSGLLLLTLLRYLRPGVVGFQALLLGMIVYSGLAIDATTTALVWAGKLLIIFSFMAALRSIPELSRVAFKACICAVICNLLLIVLAKLGLPGLSEIVGARGRHATLLNYPGSLWHTGLACLFYFSYLVTAPKGLTFTNLMGLGACLAVMCFDGSRTGFLLLFALPVVLVLVLTIEGRMSAVWLLFLGIAVGGGAIISLCDFDEETTIARLLPILQSRGDTSGMLASIDHTRYDMIRHALELIAEHPIVGNGLRAATLATTIDAAELMAVHNAYLQCWADLGAIGLIGLIGVLTPWWRHVPYLLRAIRTSSSPRQRAYFYNAIFLLFAFNFCLLFHPLSVEWSEWILFVVPLTALEELFHMPAIARAGTRAQVVT